MNLDMLKQKHTERVIEWVTRGAIAVAVEVESIVYPNRPGEIYFTPDTVRRLEEVSKLAEAGNVEALHKAGKVYVHLREPFDLLTFGYDPGGATKVANGVALLEWPRTGNPRAVVDNLASVNEVLDWLREHVGDRKLSGAGLDTFLSWSTSRCGTRPMDTLLRQRYQNVGKSILDSNSTFGSMVIQGMAVAMRLRETWSSIRLNETHPKVLYHALTDARQQYEYGPRMVQWLEQQFTPALILQKPISNEHEWDALFSAWATWKGLAGGWQTDLMDCVPAEQRLMLPAGQVSYFWPEALDEHSR